MFQFHSTINSTIVKITQNRTFYVSLQLRMATDKQFVKNTVLILTYWFGFTKIKQNQKLCSDFKISFCSDCSLYWQTEGV